MSEDVLATLLAYWQGKISGDALPSRGDIDPCELRRILSSIALVDLLDDSGAMRFRLTGTGVVRMLGFDPTGANLGDIDRIGAGSPFWNFLDTVRADRSPVRERIPYFGRISSFGVIDLVGLPLQNSDRVDMVLLGFCFVGATSGHDNIVADRRG